MKGIVFTEFLDFVADSMGADMVDDIIDDSNLPSGGAYTAVGTYAFTEMGALVAALSRRTSVATPALLQRFGRHLCRRFVVRYPDFFDERTDLFDFLASVDGKIHVEVRKLYPDAELPAFRLASDGTDRITFDYESCRPLEALAEGMIMAAAEHYREPITLDKAAVQEPGRSFVRFTIRRAARSMAA